MMSTPDSRLQGITMLERGWLSSNNVLLHGTPDQPGAVLVDSAHMNHAAQTVALVQQALNGEALQEVVNTHLHSDHCGGNASLHRHFGCPLRIPPGQWQAALDWDEAALSYRPTGQRCERFRPTGQVLPGQTLQVGQRRWHVLAAPGHDPHSIILFDADEGVLISADALWHSGFGVVFPELDGEHAFDDVAAVLDLIASLDAKWVIPGHGAAFSDVSDAIARARSRLANFRQAPDRHAWYAAKVMVKYHLLEEGQQKPADLLRWLEETELLPRVWGRLGHPHGSFAAFGERILDELRGSQAVILRDGVLFNN